MVCPAQARTDCDKQIFVQVIQIFVELVLVSCASCASSRCFFRRPVIDQVAAAFLRLEKVTV